MMTITEQAKTVLRAMADTSSVNAVAKALGIRQQTLQRFLSNPDAGMSLKNYEKIAHLLTKKGRAA